MFVRSISLDSNNLHSNNRMAFHYFAIGFFGYILDQILNNCDLSISSLNNKTFRLSNSN